jgi:hypothetical protein
MVQRNKKIEEVRRNCLEIKAPLNLAMAGFAAWLKQRSFPSDQCDEIGSP